MNEMQVFSNPEFGAVRAILIDGEPWFVGRDVAAVLGYGGDNPTSKALTDAIRRHIDPEDKRHLSFQEFQAFQAGAPDFQGRRFDDLESPKVTEKVTLNDVSHYGAYIINESGVYALIFGSKLPMAKGFKHWVTSEVLPALREQGSYTMPGAETSLDPKDYLKAADILSKCRENRLSMVVGVLVQAGFDVVMRENRPYVAPEPIDPKVNTENQAHLRELLSRYSVYEAADITGMAPGVISRYRSGKSRPRPERCAQMIGALEL